MTPEILSPQKLARIWEVFAQVKATPAEAAAALERHCGLQVSEEEAARQIAAAKQRNSLCLVTDRADVQLGSSFGRRVKSRPWGR